MESTHIHIPRNLKLFVVYHFSNIARSNRLMFFSMIVLVCQSAYFMDTHKRRHYRWIGDIFNL